MESRDYSDGIAEDQEDGRIVIPELEEFVGKQYRPKWSEEEDAVLISYYGRVPTKKIAEHLDRSHNAVQRRAASLGLSFK